MGFRAAITVAASRRRLVGANVLLIIAAGCLRLWPGAFSFHARRAAASPGTTHRQRTTLNVGGDPVNNVSPEMNAASIQYAQRYEDIMLKGKDIWTAMKKAEKPKKVFFIGVPGSNGAEVGESVCDALGYIPAPDGTKWIHRKPAMGYPPIKYTLWETDKVIGNLSKIAPTDLYIEDEAKYRELEKKAIKDFVDMEPNGYPMACVVGEGALTQPENVEQIKTGVVVWLDCEPGYSWMKVMTRPNPSAGLFIPPQFQERPPAWAIANGWDGDPDDTEGKEEYVKIIESRREIFEKAADIRLRTDIAGIGDNSYWAAERILKSLAEHLGISTEETTVEQEVMEKDLAKFLEGARLSKYLEAALEWCDEQGAASIEDVVENIPDFSEALKLKPLEKKRLEKAAAAVVA